MKVNPFPRPYIPRGEKPKPPSTTRPPSTETERPRVKPHKDDDSYETQLEEPPPYKGPPGTDMPKPPKA